MLKPYLEKLDELAEQKYDIYNHLSHHSKEEERKPYHANMAVLMVFAKQRIKQLIEATEWKGEETEGNDE